MSEASVKKSEAIPQGIRGSYLDFASAEPTSAETAENAPGLGFSDPRLMSEASVKKSEAIPHRYPRYHEAMPHRYPRLILALDPRVLPRGYLGRGCPEPRISRSEARVSRGQGYKSRG